MSSWIQQVAPHERPREKLSARGEASCSDEELLALLLGHGSRGLSVIELARSVLSELGGLAKLQQAQVGELTRIEGLGQSRACAIVAAFALGKRASRHWMPGAAFQHSRQVFEHFQPLFRGLRKERFYVLLLDSKNRLLREELVSEGTLTASLVHPREVFGPAIREGAASILALHNHPSGDSDPSPEDHEVTRRLKSAGNLLGIQLLDHIVMGQDDFYSFRESGKI